jgi:hypothetical protein
MIFYMLYINYVYILHVKSPWIILNMVYGVNKGLSHKVLVHNPCSLKLWIVAVSNRIGHSIS